MGTLKLIELKIDRHADRDTKQKDWLTDLLHLQTER